MSSTSLPVGSLRENAAREREAVPRSLLRQERATPVLGRTEVNCYMKRRQNVRTAQYSVGVERVSLSVDGARHSNRHRRGSSTTAVSTKISICYMAFLREQYMITHSGQRPDIFSLPHPVRVCPSGDWNLRAARWAAVRLVMACHVSRVSRVVTSRVRIVTLPVCLRLGGA